MASREQEQQSSGTRWGRIIWASICVAVLFYNAVDHWIMGNAIGVGMLAAFLAMILLTLVLWYLDAE
jgi:hypothetical protein